MILNSLIFALKKLEDVQDIVQQDRIQNERARESSGRNPEDKDASMCGDGIKPAYAIHEVKKRHGVRFLSPVCSPPPNPQDANFPPIVRLLPGVTKVVTG